MFSLDDAHLIDDPDLRQQVKTHPRAQELLRALLYPYPAPGADYVLRGGVAVPLAQVETPIDDLLAHRTPVVAAGSNRAPAQLARKYAPPHNGEDVPVTFGWLADHDIAYAAHITGYGSVPAALVPCAGTDVRIALNWLTPTQLSRMHATESLGHHYEYRHIRGELITLDCAAYVGMTGYYHALYGIEFQKGESFAFPQIAARHRRFPEADQWSMVSYLAARAGQAAHPDFILRLIDDPEFRKSLCGRR